MQYQKTSEGLLSFTMRVSGFWRLVICAALLCTCAWIAFRISAGTLVGDSDEAIEMHQHRGHQHLVPSPDEESSHKVATEKKSSKFVEPNEAIAKVQALVDSFPELDNGKLTHGFEWQTIDKTTLPRYITSDMSDQDAEDEFHKFINQLQVKCPEKARIGRVEDGGWDACVAEPFAIKKPCLVYSIGMGGEWSFDNMITSDKYSCQDMAYDPTLGKQDHKANPLLWFYNTGMGKTNSVNSRNWKLRTFGTMMQENNHSQSTIDILKIDIEYSEWESLEAILQEGSLRNVKQFMFEFHTREVDRPHRTSAADYAYYYQLLRGVERLGFKPWHVLLNLIPETAFDARAGNRKLTCYGNVYYVNTKLIV